MAQGLNLLSLDGGGITVLSSLLILKEVMSRLQVKTNLAKRPDPWEHFDLIAGTGTGALCAIMLGRLRMSVEDAIKAYAELASKVYSDKKTAISSGSGTFSATKMEESLKAIIKNKTGNSEELMMEDNPADVKCKVVVYAMSAHNMNAALPCPFRTYQANANSMPDCPIWKALRASTAHPELFKSVVIGELGIGQRYVGGGLGCSNPTAQMLKEVSRLYPNRLVGSVVSIGTGHAETIQIAKSSWYESLLPRSIVRVLRVAHALATDNERVAEEMAARFSEAEGVYHRLNVNQGMQSIKPAEWEKQNEVTGHTKAYMLQAETSRLIDTIVAGVHERHGIVTTHHIDGRAVLPRTAVTTIFIDCPLPTALFTGRKEEIDTIKRYFERDDDPRKVFVLIGLGGAGKTQTALKSAELLTPRLEGLLFVDGSSRQNIEAALCAFAASKNLGNAYMDALRWLGSRNMRWLVLFDNVDDPTVQLDQYFPRGTYNILITTRHTDVASLARDDSAQCVISKLNPEDALRMLLKSAGLSNKGLQVTEKAAASVLLEKLGHLALAISQCGAYVRRNKCSIAQYYDMLISEPQEMLGVNETNIAKARNYKPSVHLTLEFSYKQVSMNARRVMDLAAFLHRDHISESIFRRAHVNMAKYKSAIPLTDAEAGAQREVKYILELFVDKEGNWSSRRFIEAMGEFLCLSLVTCDVSSQVYRLHPLVQEWIRALAPEAPIAIERSAFLLALSIDEGTDSEDHAFRRAVIPHINEIMGLCPTPRANNAWRFIKAYDEAGQVEKYEQLEQFVLEARTLALGPEHPATLEAMFYVAGTHSTKGELEEAAGLLSQVLATQIRVLGSDHIDTLRSMNGLGSIYTIQDQLIEAEELQVETLAACKKTLTKDHPQTLLSMSNLAVTYYKQGRLAEAEELSTVVLDARKRVLGDEHPETLASMSNLAVDYFGQGRYEDAEALHSETRAIQRRVLGDDHRDTLLSTGELASTYHELGRFSEAETLGMEVLAGRKRALGDCHPETVKAMRNLALTYSAQGQQAKYEVLTAQADAICANT